MASDDRISDNRTPVTSPPPRGINKRSWSSHYAHLDLRIVPVATTRIWRGCNHIHWLQRQVPAREYHGQRHEIRKIFVLYARPSDRHDGDGKIHPEPWKILFHIGTNDIEAASPQAVAENLDTLLYETRIRLKTTKLFLSAIILRKDLMDKVNEANDLFQQIILKYYGSFLKHKYIRESMLGDKKHLND